MGRGEHSYNRSWRVSILDMELSGGGRSTPRESRFKTPFDPGLDCVNALSDLCLSPQSPPCNAWWGRGNSSYFSLCWSHDFCSKCSWHSLRCRSTNTWLNMFQSALSFSRKFWKPRWSDPKWSRGESETMMREWKECSFTEAAMNAFWVIW